MRLRPTNSHTTYTTNPPLSPLCLRPTRHPPVLPLRSNRIPTPPPHPPQIHRLQPDPNPNPTPRAPRPMLIHDTGVRHSQPALPGRAALAHGEAQGRQEHRRQVTGGAAGAVHDRPVAGSAPQGAGAAAAAGACAWVLVWAWVWVLRTGLGGGTALLMPAARCFCYKSSQQQAAVRTPVHPKNAPHHPNRHPPTPTPTPTPPHAPSQALPSGKVGDKYLLLWSVEDAVKSRYSQFIGLLENTSTDPLDYLKVRRWGWAVGWGLQGDVWVGVDIERGEVGSGAQQPARQHAASVSFTLCLPTTPQTPATPARPPAPNQTRAARRSAPPRPSPPSSPPSPRARRGCCPPWSTSWATPRARSRRTRATCCASCWTSTRR